MSFLVFRILMTIATLLVVGWMVWDQRRLNRMTLLKWTIAAALVVVLVAQTWIAPT